ncbi:unnamed protein product [Rotaria socialis]|uniref:LRAT domain-containing protein n=1 Tax=Rotaria socialis TaxID=392032 RepID=A0A821TE81_9BILA|nr:unnamed protein product [Rotaria socialis]CAF4870255.1 unnamed protein product [Rotaria socialis]
MGNFNDRVPHATYTNPSNMQLYDVIKHVWRDAEPGDMIQYHRIDYEHWAIYIGNDKVIQATVRDFGNTFMDKFMSAMVTIITFGRQTAFAKITEESFHNVLQSDGVGGEFDFAAKSKCLYRNTAIPQMLLRYCGIAV